MFQRFIVAAIFATVTTAATSAAIAEDGRAGSAGTVTAYELDGRTVIDTKTCFRTGRYSTYDYSRCSGRLRDTVKLRVCRDKGNGTHHYFSQHGNGRMLRASVFCSSRRY